MSQQGTKLLDNVADLNYNKNVAKIDKKERGDINGKMFVVKRY